MGRLKRRTSILLVQALIIGLPTIGLFAPPASAAVFVVNDTGDAGDATPGDGFCDTGGGVCTLRAAIEESNALGGQDVVRFDITPNTIAPGSPLPAITESIRILGNTDPDYAGTPVVRIDASGQGAGNGFDLNGTTGSVIRGLSITGAPNAAVFVQGGADNVVLENYLGVAPDGSGAGNTNGVVLRSSTTGNVVRDNVISGNSNIGVVIRDAGTTDNVVRNNRIGTNPGASASLSNGHGVQIFDSAAGNRVLLGNVISGNNADGVRLLADGNVVRDNLIGTNGGGAALGNGTHGIRINASSNIIRDNRIANNGGDGVAVEGGVGNRIDPNTFDTNGGLGIDLNDDGVTANDGSPDADAGPNNLQNFPELTKAVSANGSGTIIDGELHSVPSTNFLIEFFSNASCDPSGHGEGDVFLGDTIVTTDGSGDVTFSVTVAGSTSIGDEVTATATNQSTNDTSEFSACRTVTAEGDLEITKSAPGTAVAGDTFQYTIEITNNGPSTSEVVTMTDELPAEVDFVSFDTCSGGTTAPGNDCNHDPGPPETVTWGPGDVAPGETVTIVFTVEVDQGTPEGTTIQNEASVTSAATPDPVPSNNTSTVVETDVETEADMEVQKTGPATIAAGEPITYSITFNNNGPSKANNLVMEDDLPPAITGAFVSSAPVDVSCVVLDDEGTSNPDVRCTKGGMNSGASRTVEISGTIAPQTPAGDITNTATITADETDPGGGNNSSDVVTTVERVADLEITKTDDPDPVTAGETLEYTVQVRNNGPSSTDWRWTDTLPSDVSFDSFTSIPSGVSCTHDGSPTNGVVECEFTPAAMNPGAQRTVRFEVTVDPGTSPGTDVLSNTATVTTDGDASDPTPGNDSSTETTSVEGEGDLEITKSAPATATAGETFQYTIEITNNGPSTSEVVNMSDELPAEVDFVSFDTCSGGTTAPGNECNFNPGPPEEVTWGPGDIAAGETVTIVFTVFVHADTPEGTDIENTATVSSVATPDPIDSNNTETIVQPEVETSADLRIAKGEDQDPVTAGEQLVYTVSATNDGPSDAQDVTITDTLPEGVEFVSATPTTPATCTDPGAGTITTAGNKTVECTWSGGTAPGGVRTITIVVNIPPGHPAGPITNTADVSSPTDDPDLGNNSTSEETTVDRDADLEITKLDDPDPVVAGGQLEYTVRIRNNGPSTADWEWTDTLPAEVTFDSFTQVPAPVSCGEAAGTITCEWTLANGMQPGAQRTVKFLVDVDPGTTPGTDVISNTASVSFSDTPDSVPGNDSDTELTSVEAEADLRVEKTDSRDPVNAGSAFNYIVTVTNDGPSDATDVTLTDTLPGTVEFVSIPVDPTGTCSHDGSPTGGDVDCGPFDLAAGDSVTIEIRVSTPSDHPEGDITNSAEVDSATPDPDSGDNSTTEDTTVRHRADLGITKTDSPDPVVAGTDLTYTVEVTNGGPSIATSPTMTDDLSNRVFFGSIDTTGAPGWVCVTPAPGDINGTVSCTAPSLDAGETATFVITVTVRPGVRDGVIIENTAEVDAATPQPVSNTLPDSATTETTVEAHADLEITKTDDPDPVVAGETLTYEITVTNNGPSTARDLVVEDDLPEEVTGATVADDGTFTCTVDDAEGTSDPDVTCTRAALFPGASRTIVIEVTVESGTPAGTIITNDVEVTQDPDITDDPSANNTASTDTEVTVVAEVSIDKTDSPDPVIAGTTLTYEITVTNDGPSDAQDLEVTDDLPSELTAITVTDPDGFICTVHDAEGDSDPDVTCTRATMAPGTATIVIEATVEATTADGTTITNEVEVTQDPAVTDDPLDNTDSEDTLVNREADLEISKTADPDPAFPGATLTYTVEVTNNGPSAAEDVTITDDLPPETTFVSATPSAGGSCTTPAVGDPNGTVTCEWTGDTLPGETRTVEIVVEIDEDITETTTIENTATADSEDTDPDTDNNTTTIETDAECDISGTAGNDDLFGTAGDDIICGGPGNDRLFGLDGDDILIGGSGRDGLFGQDGEDRLFGNSGDDSGSSDQGLYGGAGIDELDGGSGFDLCDPQSPGTGETTTNCETASPASTTSTSSASASEPTSSPSWSSPRTSSSSYGYGSRSRPSRYREYW